MILIINYYIKNIIIQSLFNKFNKLLKKYFNLKQIHLNISNNFKKLIFKNKILLKKYLNKRIFYKNYYLLDH